MKVCYGYVAYSIVQRRRIANGVPPADNDGDMEDQLGSVEEMVVEMDAQVAAAAAQDVADAF